MQGGQEASLHRMDVRDAQTVEFANALRAALEAHNMSLADAQRHLKDRGVSLSVATLSYWRSGERQPDPVRSARTLSELEMVLGVAEGTFSRLVSGHSRRLGSLSRVEEPSGTDARRARTLGRLGVTPPENFRILSLQEVIDVDARAALSKVKTILLVQCVKGSLESLGFVEVAQEPTRVGPEWTATAGGRIDNTRGDGGVVFGARLMLDRVLVPGETAMVEVEEVFPHEFPQQRTHALVAARRIREVLQWFRFTEGHAPDWFEEQVGEEPPRTLLLSHSRSVHRSRTDFGPATLFTRWGRIEDD